MSCNRAGWGVFILLLSVSCQTHGAWLFMCDDQPLPVQNNRDQGYLAHVLNAEEKAVLLQVSATQAERPGCEAQEVPVSADEVIWAGFAKPAEAKARQLALQGRELNGRFAVSEIMTADDSEAPPSTPAGKFRPSGKDRRLPPPLRASWFWSPAAWLDTPQRIFDSQASLGLKRIYITVPVDEGQVRHAGQLRQFLQTAHQRDLQVWAVLGDPHAVLDQERQHFLALATAYQVFNAGGAEQKLDGLQLDIEPYLLPGYQLNPAAWLRKQAKTVNAVHQIAPSLALDMVLPFWFEPLKGDGAAMLADVEASIAGITLMNYRTDPEQIRTFAEKFLEWGERRQKAVYIALESLAMQEEDRRVYRQAESGELWRFNFREAPVLLLLQQPVRDLPGGKAYRFLYSRKIDGSGTSFFQQPGVLIGLLPALEKQFGAWASFAGIALHGFEQP